MREIGRAEVRLPNFQWDVWWTNAVLMGVQTGAAFGDAFVKAAGLQAVQAAARVAVQNSDPTHCSEIQVQLQGTYAVSQVRKQD